jgi:hypothetical protein
VTRLNARLDRLEKQMQEKIALLDGRRHRAAGERCQAAVQHAAILGTLIVYGDPVVREPLANAWDRATEQLEHKETLPFSGFPSSDNSWNGTISNLLRRHTVPIWPGDDERDRLNRLFKIAPPWLLWFTHGDFTAQTLKFDSPDLSPVKRFDRQTPFKIWPALPSGAFEERPWPSGAQDEPPLSASEVTKLYEQPRLLSKDARPRRRLKELLLLASAGPQKEPEFKWPWLDGKPPSPAGNSQPG